jgi:methionine biosynthesis protein MetW
MDEQKRSSYAGLRLDVISMISKKPNSVLDVGCSNGVFLQFAKNQLGAKFTVGIENDLEFIQEAMQRADKIIKMDLDFFSSEKLNSQKFDLIVLADVLEHTKDPFFVLNEVLNFATSDTKIIISLPNIQHWTAIKNLIIGKWPIRERGLFDRTHLHFFTLQSIEDLAAQCGLKIEKKIRNYRIVDKPDAKINSFARLFCFWPLAPYFTYQYVIRLSRP